MNNSEGQTQEPVGGMKSLPSIYESGVISVKITENITPKLTAKEQAFFVAGFKECVKYLSESTPSPSPVGIDVEELILAFIVDALHEKYPSSKKITAGILYILSKAGFSASLPQSSTEEENSYSLSDIKEHNPDYIPPVTGESEGERKFTLKEALDILNEAKDTTRQIYLKCPHCQISPVMCKCCGETL